MRPSDGVAGRGRSGSVQNRAGRSGSQEGREAPAPSSSLQSSASVASMPARTGRVSAIPGDLLSISASMAAMEATIAARDDDAHAQFKLPPEVDAELALMQVRGCCVGERRTRCAFHTPL